MTSPTNSKSSARLLLEVIEQVRLQALNLVDAAAKSAADALFEERACEGGQLKRNDWIALTQEVADRFEAASNELRSAHDSMLLLMRNTK